MLLGTLGVPVRKIFLSENLSESQNFLKENSLVCRKFL